MIRNGWWDVINLGVILGLLWGSLGFTMRSSEHPITASGNPARDADPTIGSAQEDAEHRLYLPMLMKVLQSAQPVQVGISPTSGRAGTLLTVSLSGFPANSLVWFGPSQAGSDPISIKVRTTRPDGSLASTLQIPGDAWSGTTWVILAASMDGGIRGVSEIFLVTDE